MKRKIHLLMYFLALIGTICFCLFPSRKGITQDTVSLEHVEGKNSGVKSDDSSHAKRRITKETAANFLKTIAAVTNRMDTDREHQVDPQELVNAGGGDLAERRDANHDVYARARAEHFMASVKVLERALEVGPRITTKELELTEQIANITSKYDGEHPDMDDVLCVSSFCRVRMETDKLEEAVRFLEFIGEPETMNISHLSPNIQVNGNDPDAPVVSDVYFSMGGNKLPVDPADYEQVDRDVEAEL